MLRQTKAGDGFTVVEVLIALVITALLLTATATAFNASVVGYRANEDIFKSINNARQALYRMTTQIRTGQSFKLTDPATKCTFFTADNQDITYEYRASDKKLHLINNDTGRDYVLCENVTALNFTKALTTDGTDLKSVCISITVSSGNVQKKVSAAAAIRKNMD